MSDSQCAMILRYIQETGSITPIDAMREFACMRLGARCYDLKKLGYDIVTTTEEAINRFGKKVSFARYSIAMPKGQLSLF